MATYSMYSQLTSIAGGHPFHPQPEVVLCCGDKGTHLTWINKSTETLIDVSKEGGLEVNVEKTKYMLESHYQNADQNRDIKIANT
jgi:hypothetical protein